MHGAPWERRFRHASFLTDLVGITSHAQRTEIEIGFETAWSEGFQNYLRALTTPKTSQIRAIVQVSRAMVDFFVC